MSHSPAIAGVHHVKLPVADYERSVEWYCQILGFEVAQTFGDPSAPAGAALRHPASGVLLGLHADPELAARSAGFDYFAFLVEDRACLDTWARHVTDLGATTQGIHAAAMGSVLALSDPDGHTLLLYSAHD